MKRSIYTLSLIFIIIILLTACGSRNEETSNPTDTPYIAETTTEQPTETAEPQEDNTSRDMPSHLQNLIYGITYQPNSMPQPEGDFAVSLQTNRIAAGENTFAIINDSGELYIFTIGEPIPRQIKENVAAVHIGLFAAVDALGSTISYDDIYAITDNGILWHFSTNEDSWEQIAESVAHFNYGHELSIVLQDGTTMFLNTYEYAEEFVNFSTTDPAMFDRRTMPANSIININRYHVIIGSAQSTASSLLLRDRTVSVFPNHAHPASSSARHNFAITYNNQLWGWGHNANGTMGDPNGSPNLSPIHIMDDVAKVVSSDLHQMALTTDGRLYTWGLSPDGQAGRGNRNRIITPDFLMDNVIYIATGLHHSYAITSDNALWHWGERQRTPVQLMSNVVEVSTARDFTLIRTTNGEVSLLDFTGADLTTTSITLP